MARSREKIAIAMTKRNAEIGRLLERVRTSRNISMAACAAEINTSRQRYAAIERGSSFVGAVELERLLHLLEISAEELWANVDVEGGEQRVFHDISVRLLPGEIVRVVIDAAPPTLVAGTSEAPSAEDDE